MSEEIVKYYDEDSWRKYFSIDVAELYSSVKGLLKLRDELLAKLGSDTVSNLVSKSEIYKEILFGGFRADESKPFTDNALAMFYKTVLGIGIDDKDISIVISRIKEGFPLEKAVEGISYTKKNTPIIDRLIDISSKLDAVYNNLRGIIEKPKPKEYKLTSSTAGLDALLDVLNAGKKLLPLYNPLSFFIISIYSIPKFYATEAYPKLFEENVQLLLKKYGIYIVKLLEPDLPDEKIRSEREIIGLEDHCVGYLIREIILDIYSIFQVEELKNFFNIEDEFNKYVETYIDKLKESIVAGRFKNVIETIKITGSFSSRDPRERVSINKYSFYSHYRGRYGENPSEIVGGDIRLTGYSSERNISYTEFFAFLAPQMYLGLAYARPYDTDSKKFKWLCVLGWEE